jgi:hypothetical protein
VSEQPELEYLGDDFVNFKDGSYGWVHMKRFRLPPGVTSQTALQLLLGHVRYRDFYTGANPHEEPSEREHGRYWLDRITTDSFEPVDEEAALNTIAAFVAAVGAVGPNVVASLESTVYPLIRAMPVRFRLRDLGDEDVHEWGWVLAHFNELVLVDPSAGQLALLVAATD